MQRSWGSPRGECGAPTAAESTSCFSSMLMIKATCDQASRREAAGLAVKLKKHFTCSSGNRRSLLLLLSLTAAVMASGRRAAGTAYCRTSRLRISAAAPNHARAQPASCASRCAWGRHHVSVAAWVLSAALKLWYRVATAWLQQVLPARWDGDPRGTVLCLSYSRRLPMGHVETMPAAWRTQAASLLQAAVMYFMRLPSECSQTGAQAAKLQLRISLCVRALRWQIHLAQRQRSVNYHV